MERICWVERNEEINLCNSWSEGMQSFSSFIMFFSKRFFLNKSFEIKSVNSLLSFILFLMSILSIMQGSAESLLGRLLGLCWGGADALLVRCWSSASSNLRQQILIIFLVYWLTLRSVILINPNSSNAFSAFPYVLELLNPAKFSALSV